MIFNIIKFIFISTILGGIIKIYFKHPFIQNNPKVSAAALILVILFVLWIIPRSLGFIFKLFIILVCLFGLGYFGYTFFGPSSLWIKETFSFISSQKPQTLEEIVEEQTNSIASYQDHETVTGQVSQIRSGYFFQIGSSFIKLYGIDAPDPSQNCLAKRGNSYPCGKMSKETLERLILKKIVSCTPVGGDRNGNYIATCAIEGIDVGSVMVSSGWAIADKRQSKVYIPYEKQAHDKKIGLWEGSFTEPWEYRNKIKYQKQPQHHNFFGFLK